MLALLATLASMPWLQGFDAATIADRGRPATDEVDATCVASAYGDLELTADVASAAGDESVVASFTRGITVFDRNHRPIAHAQGFVCQGSADELVAMAVGDASIGAPVIALAASTGGHNDSATWLTLYRVGAHGELVAMFSNIVERHKGHATRTGVVTLVPGGLIYRPPVGNPSFWRYDRDAGRYIEQMAIDNVA